MSLGINSVECGVVAPRKEQPKRPWVMDESIPRARDPQEVMFEKMQAKILKDAKNKSDEERNFFDYLVLGKEKLDKLAENSVIYMA